MQPILSVLPGKPKPKPTEEEREKERKIVVIALFMRVSLTKYQTIVPFIMNGGE